MHKNTGWKIISNSDNIDVSNQSLGFEAWRESIPSDVAKHIHSNRGLHISIKWNNDPQTLAQAMSLASLITAAPDLLAAVESLLSNISSTPIHRMPLNALALDVAKLYDAVKKAKGGTP